MIWPILWMDDIHADQLGAANPSAINGQYEASKLEFSVNGISVKDLLATKSTLSREEINWMISALEGSKVRLSLLRLSFGRLTASSLDTGYGYHQVVCSRKGLRLLWDRYQHREIGRASCRERVLMPV